jgi:hypothetical protein
MEKTKENSEIKNETISEQITEIKTGHLIMESSLKNSQEQQSPENVDNSSYSALPVLHERKNKTLKINLQKYSQKLLTITPTQKSDIQLPVLKANEKTKQSPLAFFKPGDIPKPPPLPNFEVPLDSTGKRFGQ